MRVVRIIGIVILLMAFNDVLLSQESYILRMESIYENTSSSSNYTSYIFNAENPLEFIFSTLFVGYKLVLSSQDMDSCVFHPSCSVYGIQAIKKKGIIIGTIDTFDRLTRCHPFAGKNYEFDANKNRLYDPVD